MKKQINNKQQLLKEILLKGEITKQDALKGLQNQNIDPMALTKFFTKVGDMYYYGIHHRVPLREGETREQADERQRNTHQYYTRDYVDQLKAEGYRILIFIAASERKQSDSSDA